MRVGMRVGALLALALALAVVGWAWALSRVECFEDGSCRGPGGASWCIAGAPCELETYPDGRPWP